MLRLFNPEERASFTHLIGGRAGPRAGQDAVEKRIFFLPCREHRFLSRPITTLTELLHFQMYVHKVSIEARVMFCAIRMGGSLTAVVEALTSI
jgi:hypothetical protein